MARTKAYAFFPHRGRLVAGAVLAGIIAVMFAIHQTQIEGMKPLLRLLALVIMSGTGLLALYLWRKSRRTDPLLRLDGEGVTLALGTEGVVHLPWDQIAAYKYWEPTGWALLVKRRQARWVGLKLHSDQRLRGLPWDQRMELWLNWWNRRPELCILDPHVDASILEVLEAFQKLRRDLDDPMGKIIA